MMKTPAPQLAATACPAYSQTMPCRPESARHARVFTAFAFGVWNLGALADAAVLCASELVTNAVQHSGAEIIQMSVSRPCVRCVHVAVAEKGHALPVRERPEPYDEHGRGLILINALSDRWGADRLHWGKRVWCEFDTYVDEERTGRLDGTSAPGHRCGGGVG